MLLKKTIKLPVYDCSVHFMLTDEVKKELLKICKKHKMVLGEDEEYEGLVVYPTISTYYLIIDTKYLTYNTILHEVYHLASMVCNQRDIQNEEAAAWVSGHVGSTIINFLLKKEFKIK